MSLAVDDTSKSKSENEKNTWFNDLAFLNRGLSELTDTVRDSDRILISVGEAGTLKSRLAYAFLASAFQSADSNKSGAILLSSEGQTLEKMQAAFKDWGAKVSPCDNGESRVLVRPILPRFLSSSNFVFRLRVCIREMKRRLQLDMHKASGAWRIRVVIDNWNSIVDAHPSLQNDDQLLQSVFSVLRDEGVLALIVATQPGSPAVTDRANRCHDLTRMEATRIHSWPVNFFGDNRIAICTSIPGKDGQRTSVGELCRNEYEYKIEIKENFDYYEDLETGKARRVKLKVKLYSGFDESTDSTLQRSASYNHEVSALFGDLFARTEAMDDVVSFEGIKNYDSFKDYIQNLETAQLEETLVFQVDEFWNGQSSTSCFADLNASFFDEALDVGSFPDSNHAKTTGRRVPLHKDFGLILADSAAWFEAKDVTIDKSIVLKLVDGKYLEPFSFGKIEVARLIPNADAIKASPNAATSGDAGSSWKLTVGHIWNALCIGGENARFDLDKKLLENSVNLLNPSWELFLLASQIVALHTGKRSFDIDLRTSESLSSLVLEIWFTDIVNRQIQSSANSTYSKVVEDLMAFAGENSLQKLVQTYAIELEYALRLSIRFLPGRFRERTSQLSPPDRDAVSIRTWYATASHCQQLNPNLAPLRLPGKFCVRGDWYLAVAQGSRSIRLAESAIRKLTSEPMNRKRFRDGIGLPVLQISKFSNLESALQVPEPRVNTYRPLKLSEINAAEPKILSSVDSNRQFYPALNCLFRSKVLEYNAFSEEFFQLISTVLRKIKPIEDEDMLGFGAEQSPKGELGQSTTYQTKQSEIRAVIQDFVSDQKGKNGQKDQNVTIIWEQAESKKTLENEIAKP